MSDWIYLLCEAAASMPLVSKKCCALKAWCMQVANRSGTGEAIVAVARRLAIVMHRMWITGEDFRFGPGAGKNSPDLS